MPKAKPRKITPRRRLTPAEKDRMRVTAEMRYPRIDLAIKNAKEGNPRDLATTLRIAKEKLFVKGTWLDQKSWALVLRYAKEQARKNGVKLVI